MADDPPAQPLPLEAGVQLPGALDHAWVIEGLDQQYSFAPDGNSQWTARVRCVHCGLSAQFVAHAVPPCRPAAARP